MTFAGTGVAQCARHCGQCFKAYPLVLRAGPLGSSKEFVSVQVVLLWAWFRAWLASRRCWFSS